MKYDNLGIFIVQVKMAEDGVKRVTGVSPMFPSISDISSISMPFSGSPSDVTSDATVPSQDNPKLFFQPLPHDRKMSSGLPPEITSAPPPVEDVITGAMAGGKLGRTASMQRVASLEHLQKRICGTPGSCVSGQHWNSAGWDAEISVNKNHN